MVVRWCFGGRNHRTCDDGLFYFSDGRKRERDAEENDVFVHSLARAASFFVFLRLLLRRRRRLPFLA